MEQRLIPEKPGEKIVLAGEAHSHTVQSAFDESHAHETEEIGKLLKRLRRSPIRHVVEPLLTGSRHPIQDIEPLLRVLPNRSGSGWQERIVAAWALGRARLTPEQREEAARTLYRVLTSGPMAETGGRIKRWLTRSVVAGSLVTSVWLIVGLLSAASGGWRWMGVLPFMVILSTVFFSILLSLPLLPVSIVIEDTRLNRLRAAAATALGRLRDVHSIGALAAALFQRDTAGCAAVRKAASSALPQALAALTPEHLYQLDSQTVPNLCHALSHSNEELVLSVLAALEKIGDGRAVDWVERIARKDRMDAIHAMAERILPILRERRRQETDPSRLLRASDTPMKSADVLLRPARSSTTEAKRLLRPEPGSEETP